MKIKRLGDFFGLGSKSTDTAQPRQPSAEEIDPVAEADRLLEETSPSAETKLVEETDPAEDHAPNLETAGDTAQAAPESQLGNPPEDAPAPTDTPEPVLDHPANTDTATLATEADIQTLEADSGVSSSIQSDDQQLATQVQAMDEKSSSITYSEKQIASGQALLGEFLQKCEGSYGVIVSSIDGNPVVHQNSRDLPVERLANMTSSLLALGETIARESLQKLCRFVILENRDGRVVCLRINRVLMLTCITSKQSNLGMVLNIGQKTSEGLTGIF